MAWRAAIAAWLAAGMLLPGAAWAETAYPPTINCAKGFDGLRAHIQSLAGVEWGTDSGYDVAKLAVPDMWRVEIGFTAPGHPAHPAVTMRTFRKQVTGVWTADSKGCGFGDPSQFSVLMAELKAGDTELTNASRAEVERQKSEQSPLGPP